MRLILYQPDIPQNTGTLMRLGACMGVGLDIVEPCGFPLSDRDLKRAAMDYGDQADIARHRSWQHFLKTRKSGARLVLLSTRGETPYWDFTFQPSDCLVLGRESAGASAEVWDSVDASIIVPMQPGLRSLNVAVSAAMVLGEALRQTDGFPRTALPG
jgi:tRNA (cytidine/uridine-2'-O-)-methyltransferase